MCCCANDILSVFYKLNSKQIGSFSSVSSNTSVVLALWNSMRSLNFDDVEKRPVRVNFFAKHSIQVSDVQHTVISVCVSWFKKHVHNTL